MCFDAEQIYQEIKAKRNLEKIHELRHTFLIRERLPCSSLAATQNEV